MNKKTWLGVVIGILLGLIILGFAYFYFFVPKDDSTPNSIPDIFRSFFPGGGRVEDDPNPDFPPSGDNPPQPGTEGALAPLPKLRLISSEPVVGYIVFERSSTTAATSTFATSSRIKITETAYRFMEKARGNILEGNERDLVINKLSVTTLPKLEESFFVTKDSVVARRYDLDTNKIETFAGSLIPTTPTSTDSFDLKGSYLPSDISSIALLGNKLFSLYTSVSGATGYIQNPLGSKDVKIFSSPFSGWIVEYLGDNFLLLTSKPSSKYVGDAFILNASNGSFSKILGGVNGLTTTINYDLDKIIYSSGDNQSLQTYYKNVKEDTVLGLRSKTLPEKCVWSKLQKNIVYCAVPESIPRGEYPDVWYKGLISFTDKIVRINLDNNNETDLVYLQGESGSAIDAIKLGLDPKEKFLYFINKIDGGFWSYDLR